MESVGQRRSPAKGHLENPRSLLVTRRIIYNDDSQGVAETRPGSVEQDLRAWVDKPLSRIPVDTYAWCIAFPDVVMHDSKVAEVMGSRFDHPPNQSCAAIAELGNQGTDVLHVIADQAHRHGVEVVASIRMNDTHNRQLDPNSPGISRFVLDHPEYLIHRHDGVAELALDYSFSEVRGHILATLKELANNYEIDGLELDFVRWAKCFAREEAPFNTQIMTDFIHQVRCMLDASTCRRRGDRPILGAQVPGSLYLNHLCGLDPRTWVQRGWLDYVIQCDFGSTDPQIPTGEFAAFCRNSPCTHHVRMGNMLSSWSRKPHVSRRERLPNTSPGYSSMALTVEEARGAAANIYGFGADGIGLWNLCCRMGRLDETPLSVPEQFEFQQRMIDWACEVAHPENVWRGRRVYHFLPIHKTDRIRMRNYPVNALRMGPVGETCQIVCFFPEATGIRQVYRFQMADGKDGQTLRGSLRLRMLQSTTDNQFRFDINRQPVNPDHVRSELVPDQELPAVWHEVDLAKCPPFADQNELGITMLNKPVARLVAQDQPSFYEPYPYMEQLIVTVEPNDAADRDYAR